MNIRVWLMLMCLAGLIAGGVLVVNPFLHLDDPVPKDGGWLGALYGMAASVLIGIALIIGSAITAIGLGIAFAVEAKHRAPNVVHIDTPNPVGSETAASRSD